MPDQDSDFCGKPAAALRADPPVQVIDSRDLARLMVRLLADGQPGAFNAVGCGLSALLARPAVQLSCATYDSPRVPQRAGGTIDRARG